MSVKNEHGLTPQQERFAQLVASGNSHSEAYRQAYPRSKAWKPESVRVNAAKMSVDANVMPRIQALQKIGAALAGLDAAKVLREVAMLAHSDIAGIMTSEGKVKLPHELDPVTRAAVASFKIDEYGRIEYKFWDKGGALDKAMKHLGLFEVDNKQKSEPLAELAAMLTGNVVGPAAHAGLPDDAATAGDDD